MQYYIRNRLTGLYYDGINCSMSGQGRAWAFYEEPHLAAVRLTWGPHAEVVREERTGLTLNGKTMTTSGRWID